MRRPETSWPWVEGVAAVAAVTLLATGVETHVRALVAPGDAYVVRAVAQAGRWEFLHPEEVVSGDLVVPSGGAVKLVVSSRDVVRRLEVPALGVRVDAVPGRYATAWFRVPSPGSWRLSTTEHGRPGASHGTLVARTPAAFDAWLEQAVVAAGIPPAVVGQRLFESQGCAACHATDGSARVGPTLLGLTRRVERMADGSEVRVDEAYLRESILSPSLKVVDGFQPVMPSFRGRLRESQVRALLAYLVTL